jgi:hypothetical protein
MKRYVVVNNIGQVEEFNANTIEEALSLFKEFAYDGEYAVSVLEVPR